jgi:FKBP-type peptidyl-prolyl cis-trans isomerase 2
MEVFVGSVKEGDEVKVHYSGKFEDGTVFDSSKDKKPFQFTVGGGKVIPGFEKGVIGMETGTSKTITVPPEEGYGPVRNELIIKVKKTEIPEHIDPSEGKQLQMKNKSGQPVNLVVSKVSDDTVTLDANHPLAGKTLVFDIEVVEIG